MTHSTCSPPWAELYIEKRKENSCFCYSDLFMTENFQFSSMLVYWDWPTAIAWWVCVFVCNEKEKFYRNFLLRRIFRFLCFQSCLPAVKFSSIRETIYVHIKSHFLKDMKTPFGRAGWRRCERWKSFSPPSKSIRKRKEETFPIHNMRGYLKW